MTEAVQVVQDAACGGPAFIVLQEGGSSLEIYVHAHSSEEEAEEDRVSCARGAYRTSAPIEVDAAVAGLGEVFYEAVEKAAVAVRRMTLLREVGFVPKELPEGPVDVEEPGGKATYIIVQQGGASTEFYVCAYSSVAEANEARVACAKGAYKTTPPMKIDARLADLGEAFYGALEEIVAAVDRVDYVPVPDEDEEEEDESDVQEGARG